MSEESIKWFCSYAREDAEFVLKLATELREAGASLWLDQMDIIAGSRWDESVEGALASCQGMLAVLSPSSVASENFMDEVSYALQEGKQIIPVLYRECATPFRLRRMQHALFVGYYDNGSPDLLRALRIEKLASAPAEGEAVGIGSLISHLRSDAAPCSPERGEFSKSADVSPPVLAGGNRRAT